MENKIHERYLSPLEWDSLCRSYLLGYLRNWHLEYAHSYFYNDRDLPYLVTFDTETYVRQENLIIPYFSPERTLFKKRKLQKPQMRPELEQSCRLLVIVSGQILPSSKI